jgi:hypothetical protein
MQPCAAAAIVSKSEVPTMKKSAFGLVIVALAAIAASASADVPQLLNYQGQLSAPDGTPKHGTFTMVFSIHDAAVGGNQLPTGTPWSETQSVAVSDGVFNVLLGSVTALPSMLFTGGPSDSAGPLRFLKVVVDGESLSPLRRIGSAAYALGAAAGSGGGAITGVDYITSSGTWIRPAGVVKVLVKVWGGGGGGNRGNTDAYSNGGAGGGYAEALVDVSALPSVPVTVGAAGSGGPLTPCSTPSSGSSGGQSSFGTFAVATGGAGGDSTSPGGVGTVGMFLSAGQPGGVGTNAESSRAMGGAGALGGPGARRIGESGSCPGGGGAGGNSCSVAGGSGCAGKIAVYY